MAHTSVRSVFSQTHPLYLAHTSVRSVFSHSPSTLADTSVRSVFSQTHPPLWHTPVFSQTHPVLGRHQCQVSLQSTHPPLWQTPVSGRSSADTSVRSVFNQTHPLLWQTPVSGWSSVRLTLHLGRHQCQVGLLSDSPSTLAHTSVGSVFSQTHPVLGRRQCQVSLQSDSPRVFSQTHLPLWHTQLSGRSSADTSVRSVFSHSPSVFGRHQCQVSLQPDLPSILADTSVRSAFSQTHLPLWQTPVSGQPSARLTLISEACWLHTASSLADVTVCAVFRRVMACCILVLSSIIFFWGVQSAEHHVSQSIHQGGAAQMVQAVDSETKNTNSPAGHKSAAAQGQGEGRKELVFNAQSTMIVISG